MTVDIVRALKDVSYRESLSSEELALLPENPVGHFELTDEELKSVSGGRAQSPGSIGFTANCSRSQGGGFGGCDSSFSGFSFFC